MELGGWQEACLSPDELREESVASDRDTCFQELGCKAAVGAGGHQRRDGPPQGAVFITGEPAVGLNTRDRDQPWGPRGMTRERREEMGGSHGFASGGRISWGAGWLVTSSMAERVGRQSQGTRQPLLPALSSQGREVGSAAAPEDGHRRLRTEGEGQPAGREGDGRAGGAAGTPGRGLRAPAQGPWTGA